MNDDKYYDQIIGELGLFKGAKKFTKKKAFSIKPNNEKPVVEEEMKQGEKQKIIRIPFDKRLKASDKELQDHYNDLKSDIMAYGVKSRVSNTGDTFRLHTVTYVKIVIAGKGLKLYLALDPQDYASSTIPFQDVSEQHYYEEIPFAFRVKSGLSLRRAKELIKTVMEKGGLVQGKVEKRDWVKEIEISRD